ncbi:MAG: CDP-diacylglycerol--serine O-phosphatidyltransferase [Hyphomicrobiales bacterium]|nr:CDP-diacylglycerol--serine O-phosphatidyltransferase [Hyphomicrobiales bacterium]
MPINAGRGERVPLRRLIPNIITLLGLCAGLTAIRMAIEGRFELAIAAIVAAAMFDALDGRMARLLKAHSKFGAELDSLADFVNFGVAPAVTVYVWGLATAPSVGWAAALIFAICAALRLARFNVAASETAERPAWERRFFTGAPTPAGAILLLLPLYLEGLGVSKALFPPAVIIIHMLAVAGFMISRAPTFSGKFENARIDRSEAGPISVAAAACVVMLATYPYLTLTLAVAAYLALVPLAVRERRRLAAEHEKATRQEAASLATRLSIVAKAARD